MDVLFIQETRSWQVLFSLFFVFPNKGEEKRLALKLLYCWTSTAQGKFCTQGAFCEHTHTT